MKSRRQRLWALGRAKVAPVLATQQYRAAAPKLRRASRVRRSSRAVLVDESRPRALRRTGTGGAADLRLDPRTADERYWPQLGTLLVRASVVREIGGFDVTLRRVRGVRVAAACRRPTCPHMAEGSDGMIAKETAHIKAGEGQ